MGLCLWVCVWWAANKWCGCAVETYKEEMGYRCFGDMKETGMFGGVCWKGGLASFNFSFWMTDYWL